MSALLDGAGLYFRLQISATARSGACGVSEVLIRCSYPPYDAQNCCGADISATAPVVRSTRPRGSR